MSKFIIFIFNKYFTNYYIMYSNMNDLLGSYKFQKYDTKKSE